MFKLTIITNKLYILWIYYINIIIGVVVQNWNKHIFVIIVATKHDFPQH